MKMEDIPCTLEDNFDTLSKNSFLEGTMSITELPNGKGQRKIIKARVQTIFCHMAYGWLQVHLVSPPIRYKNKKNSNINSKNSVVVLLQEANGTGYIRGLVHVPDIGTAYNDDSLNAASTTDVKTKQGKRELSLFEKAPSSDFFSDRRKKKKKAQN